MWNSATYRFPDDESICDILGKLGEFETQTIAQWRGQSNHYSVYDREVFHRLSSEAQAELNKFYPSEDSVHRFRLSGGERVFALARHGSVLTLLWWDPEHDIYPVEPR